MIPFIVGAALIVDPKKRGPQLLLLSSAVRLVRSLTSRRKGTKNATSLDKANAEAWKDILHKVDPVLLEWSNVSMALKTKSGDTKQVLSGVSGVAKPGRLLAIMGPSGSGKTSLLNALSNQVPKNKRLSLSGSVTVNGSPSTESNHKQAYVQQEDVFFSMLSVAETMAMSAELRLPSSMPPEARQQYIDQLVATLGLNKVVDSMVGDKKTRGLSGGEKKRLSIGTELIGSPSLVFLDEPTTGLDAFSAEKVMSTLKGLAGSGHTVVAVLHQPRSSIWSMFDDLVLMSEGRCVYAGPADKALAHFQSLGYPCPPNYNPAEFLADLISIDYTTAELEQQTRSRVASLAAAWAQQQRVQPPSHVHRTVSLDNALAAANATPRAPLWKQFALLGQRSWRQVVRDRPTMIARAMANVSSALIFGGIFFRMGRSQSSVQDRLGLLQVAAINTTMSSLVKTLNTFPRERTIVSRERAKQAYSVGPYLGAKLVAELPVGAIFPLLFGSIVYPLTGLNPSLTRFAKFLGILTLESFTASALGLTVGSFAPSTDAAMAIGPAVAVVFIVFGGYYVNADNVPRVLRWLPAASLIKQAFEALALNEFPGQTFEPDSTGGGYKTGEKVLEWLSFKRKIPGTLLAQGRILLFFYWSTYSILRARGHWCQQMQEPSQLQPLPPGVVDGADGKADEKQPVAVV